VTLPLEVQIKDHKAQLQSRLDNLAKINEKTTTINDQMAVLKAAQAELAKQRSMIDDLVSRVTQHEARASLAADPPPLAPRPEAHGTIELMKGKPAGLKAATPAPRTAPPRPPAPAAGPPAAPPAGPMVPDDLFAQISAAKPAPFDSMSTQKLTPESERTQRIDPASLPAPAPEGDKTQKIAALDPAYRPDATQKMPAAEGDAETTQRLDDSIWRLQEAKRILQGIRGK
jgi:hypothetical protein